MPKPHTLPYLFDDAQRISITTLRRWGCLRTGYQQTFTMNWRRGDEVTGSIGVCIHMSSEDPFMELSYSVNGKPMRYKVYFDAVPSNLGKGEVWYFQCPQTMKRCRVLYLHRGRFVHRDGCSETMYRKQIYSAHTRGLMRLLDAHIEAEEATDEMHGRHFRTHYNGQQTKRYNRLLQKTRGAFTDPSQLESLLLGI